MPQADEHATHGCHIDARARKVPKANDLGPLRFSVARARPFWPSVSRRFRLKADGSTASPPGQRLVRPLGNWVPPRLFPGVLRPPADREARLPEAVDCACLGLDVADPPGLPVLFDALSSASSAVLAGREPEPAELDRIDCKRRCAASRSASGGGGSTLTVSI